MEDLVVPPFEAAFSLLSQIILFGMILVDCEGRAVWMNEAARQIVLDADGLTLKGGILTPARSFERARLAALFPNSLKERKGQSDRLLVGRPSGRPSYVLLVEPLATGSSEEFALILISDPDVRTALDPAALIEIFGFTAAEAQLAVAIVRGSELSEISRDTGKALPTLRVQLRALFQKTGAKRQADLVRLILAIPAVRL